MVILSQMVWITCILEVIDQEEAMMSKSKDTGSASKKVIFDTEMDEKLKLEDISKPELKAGDFLESEDELLEKLNNALQLFSF